MSQSSMTIDQATREIRRRKKDKNPVAEIADRTAYDTLINGHLDNNNILSYVRININKMAT